MKAVGGLFGRLVGAGSLLLNGSPRVNAGMERSYSAYNQLVTYNPPDWAAQLLVKPTAYVQLALRPTPIHPWKLPGVPVGFEVSVKRDDMTGSTLGGNKVRKLEFLLAEALQQGCDHIITCGGIQSNHSRATAVACRQLGLQPHLLLRQHGNIDPNSIGCQGNVLLDRAVGAKVVLLPLLSYKGEGVAKGLGDKLEEYKQVLEKSGATPYLIPIGASNTLGAWGYMEAFRELMNQGVHQEFDDIVVATGSGGTLCGLAIANYLTGSKIRVHGVCVCDNAAYFLGHIDEQLKALGLDVTADGKVVRASDIADVIEGYKGRGYGLNTDSELAQLRDIMCATGLTLDPCYTLKGVRGMLSEMQTNPARFQGNKVLYIHTGGIFGLYDGKINDTLLNSASTNQVLDYRDIIPD